MATLEQIGAALKAADAAGDTDGARRLAAAYRAMQGSAQAAPAAPGSPEDDARRVAQGGRTLADQQAYVDQQAAPYEQEVSSLNNQEGVGRALGIGGRAMLEGLAGIPDLVASPLAAGLNKILPENMQQTDVRGGVGYLLDKAGVPRAETPQERISAGVTSGLTGAVVPIGIGNQMVQSSQPVVRGVGEVLRAAPGVQVASGGTSALAGEVARESGASPGVQLAAGLVGGALPGNPIGRGAQAAQNAELPAVVAAAAERGIPIRPGGVDPDGLMGFLRNLPLTGSRGRYAEDVAKVNDRLAETIGAPKGTTPDKVYAAAETRNNGDFSNYAENYAFDLSDNVIRKMINYRNSIPYIGGIEPAAVRAIDEFLHEAGQLGTRRIPGELFKRLDTELGAVPYDKVSTRDLREFIGSLRDDYKSTMTAEDARGWDDLMRRYGDMKTMRALYAKASGRPIDPKDILGAVNTGNAGKQRVATGTRGELGTLASIGQRMREPKSSVAPGIASLAAAAGTGLATNPLAGLASLLGANVAGRIADSPWLTRFLSKPAKQDTRAAAAKAAAIGTASSEQSRKDKKRKP